MSRSKKKFAIYKDKSMKRKMRSGLTRAKMKDASLKGKDYPLYSFAVEQWDVSDYKEAYYYDNESYVAEHSTISKYWTHEDDMRDTMDAIKRLKRK